MSAKIRLARPGEEGRIGALIREVWGSQVERLSFAPEEIVDVQNLRWAYVAEIRDEFVGCIGIWGEREVLLWALSVLPQHRRRGYAGKLLTAAVNWALIRTKTISLIAAVDEMTDAHRAWFGRYGLTQDLEFPSAKEVRLLFFKNIAGGQLLRKAMIGTILRAVRRWPVLVNVGAGSVLLALLLAAVWLVGRASR